MGIVHGEVSSKNKSQSEAKRRNRFFTQAESPYLSEIASLSRLTILAYSSSNLGRVGHHDALPKRVRVPRAEHIRRHILLPPERLTPLPSFKCDRLRQGIVSVLPIDVAMEEHKRIVEV